MLKLPFIYLASKSPRRQELLQSCGVPFALVDSEIDESDYSEALPNTDIAQHLAERKAEQALKHIPQGIILAADSLVICNNVVLGKPGDKDDAWRMLRLLSDQRHDVVTGVCIQDARKRVSFSEISYVTFTVLTDEEIEFYIDHFKPFDKAGAYAIQEWIGRCKITRIEGSYTNIMGLPTERVYRTLKEWMMNDG
ncbi:MAG TPA: Maf family protein [Saprospiraceae bacterium]|nr:Maf family protein [Saprospiraceae bacterium]